MLINQTSQALSFTKLGNAAWTGREAFGLAELNGKMFVVGGTTDGFSSGNKNDVWESEDGINWTETLADGSAPFGPRWGLTLTAFDGQLWMIGGYGKATNDSSGSPDQLNDIYKSKNGKEWTQVRANGDDAGDGFTGRYGHTAPVFKDQIVIMGG